MKTKRIFLWAAVFLFSMPGCGKKAGPGAPAVAPVAQPAVPSAETAPAPIVIPPPKKRLAKYFPEGSPTRAIQDLDDMLDSYILDPKTPEEVRYNEGLKSQVLRGTFDVRELSKKALAKHWEERSSGEQDAFVDLMTRLLEKKAVFSKEQGQKKAKKKSKDLYRLTYEGDKPLSPDRSQALVMSLVHVPTENLKISLDYKVRKTPDSVWKIFDVIVDGASLLDNYKYQFDRIIDKDGYPALVHRMESKLRDLEAKSQKE